MSALLEVRGLHVRYPSRRSWLGRPREWLEAVRGVDFRLGVGETLALVGESGSGKTSIGRALVGLARHAAGQVWLRPPPELCAQTPALARLLRERGRDGALELLSLPARDWRPVRRALGLVFQDAAAALDPRLRVWSSVAEPLEIHRLARGRALRRRSVELLERVGLSADCAERYPHQLSGGQRQRVGIARALAAAPALVICDEVVSALDVLLQGRILELLRELQRHQALSYLFISHDLTAVARLAERVAVLSSGRVVEDGATREVFEQPRHPYTRALLAAVPLF